MPQLPEYRLRLFLSADLVGSTAFKADKSTQLLEIDGIKPQWVSVFTEFYAEFPRAVKAEYERDVPNLEGIENDHFPRLWKTIGDELILCSRVVNIEHLAHSVSSFVKALKSYSSSIKQKSDKLDVKGNAWVAACPVPNVGYAIHRTEDVEDNGLDTSEKIELVIDKEPYRFDFLGKAIDTGFRISKNSRADRCTVSVQLAYLLAIAKIEANFNFDLDFDGRGELKGVNNGIPYPILFIDTESDHARRALREREKTISGQATITPRQLKDFLETFMEVASIERPFIAKRGEQLRADDMPESFKNFTKVFGKLIEGLQRQDETYIAGEADAGEGHGLLDETALDVIIERDPTAR